MDEFQWIEDEDPYSIGTTYTDGLYYYKIEHKDDHCYPRECMLSKRKSKSAIRFELYVTSQLNCGLISVSKLQVPSFIYPPDLELMVRDNLLRLHTGDITPTRVQTSYDHTPFNLIERHKDYE